MAVTARWDSGVLVVWGDNDDNDINIIRDGDAISVAYGSVVIENAPSGGVTIANTTSILVYGMWGDDWLRVDDDNGPLPLVYLNGGVGDDELSGSSGVEWFDGQHGLNTIEGRGGADYIFSSPGIADITWKVGDGSDVIDDDGATYLEGTANADTVTVVGGGANVGYVFFDQTDELIGRRFENLVIDVGGGNDIVGIGGQAAPTRVLCMAGAGDDIVVGNTSWSLIISGGDGNDIIVGGSGGDRLYGNAGLDVLAGGASGDDFNVADASPGDFDYIIDFNAAEGDLIYNIGEQPLAVQFGEHVIVGQMSTGFDRGFVVLNATAAEVQAAIIG